METKNDLNEIVRRAMEIREKYRKLELLYHNKEWSVIEDALAFLTDASLVGRNLMSVENRWPSTNDKKVLRHKIGESVWWLIVLSERSGISVIDAIDDFIRETENLLDESIRTDS